MSVRIRLRRVGRKKQPYYRVVVADKHSPRDGAYIENVGFYDPRRQPAELQMDLARLDHWLGKGAELSEAAASLVRKARKGGDRKVALIVPGEVPAQPQAAAAAPAKPPRGRAAAKAAAPAVAEPAAAESAPVEVAAAEPPAAEAAAPAEAQPAPAEAQPEPATAQAEPAAAEPDADQAAEESRQG